MTEQILIATSDAQEGESLRDELIAGQDRFKMSCTESDRVLHTALSNSEISAIIADANMMNRLVNQPARSGNWTSEHKPLLLSPTFAKLGPDNSASVRDSSKKSKQMVLFSNRLNHEIDVWRRSLSDRRTSNPGEQHSSQAVDASTGFLQRGDFQTLIDRFRSRKDRRRILGCVIVRITGSNDRAQPGESSLAQVAERVKQSMHLCDIGVRWDAQTLLILRPSSPMGECWIWAEDLQSAFAAGDAAAPSEARLRSVGLSVLEVPTEDLSEAMIDAGAVAAAYASAPGSHFVQTPLTALLGKSECWRRLQKLQVLQRRKKLLMLCDPLLGTAQREHVGAHCQAVSQISVQIASALNLNQRTTRNVCLAGLFHDIGKLFVPDDVLAKPGPLTAREMQIVARHSRWGMTVCSLLGLNNDICNAVGDHHVRFDDPSRQATFIGRIICVADAVAAMAFRGDYNCAKSLDATFSELHRERGKQFDPSVVDAMCTCGGSLAQCNDA